LSYLLTAGKVKQALVCAQLVTSCNIFTIADFPRVTDDSDINVLIC